MENIDLSSMLKTPSQSAFNVSQQLPKTINESQYHIYISTTDYNLEANDPNLMLKAPSETNFS